MIRSRSATFLSFVVLATALCSFGQVTISVSFGPPVLPVYTQPLCPGPGYIWTPGYWAWSPDYGSYYWVPGTWVIAPQPGFLWTPGYWAFSSGLYLWHPGYWGTTVGFYGGIDYGYGSPGHGYYGGYWHGRDFYYNRAVNNVNVSNVRYVYDKHVVNHVNVERVSYNGGPHGVQTRPTPQQEEFAREHHMAATPQQVQHAEAARADRAQFASVNHGRPAVIATPKPGAFDSPEARHGNPAGVNRPAPTPPPRPEPQQQARHANNPPHQAAPMNPGAAPQQQAAHQAPPPRGKREEPPR